MTECTNTVRVCFAVGTRHGPFRQYTALIGQPRARPAATLPPTVLLARELCSPDPGVRSPCGQRVHRFELAKIISHKPARPAVARKTQKEWPNVLFTHAKAVPAATTAYSIGKPRAQSTIRK